MLDFGDISCSVERVSVPIVVRNNLPPFEQESPVPDAGSFTDLEQDSWIVWGSVNISQSNKMLDDVKVFDLLHFRRSPGCWTRPVPWLGDPPFSFNTVITHLSRISISHAATIQMRVVQTIPESVDSESHVTVNEELYVWSTLFATLDLATGVVEIFAMFLDSCEELFEDLLQGSHSYIIIGSLVVVPGDDPVASTEARIFREIVEFVDGSQFPHHPHPDAVR
jgi:hypothetical protein